MLGGLKLRRQPVKQFHELSVEIKAGDLCFLPIPGSEYAHIGRVSIDSKSGRWRFNPIKKNGRARPAVFDGQHWYWIL